MSVLAQNEAGWILNHEQEINQTYAVTCVSARQKACQFTAIPDLFAIHHTYMMDSQFTKSIKMGQVSDKCHLVAQRSDMPSCELADISTMSDFQPAAQSKVNISPTISSILLTREQKS